MSYGDKVWKYLLQNGSVTSKKIEKLTGTVCPHSVIRDLRKKYGFDIFDYKDTHKTKKVKVNGKETTEHTWNRTWFLKKLEGV